MSTKVTTIVLIIIFLSGNCESKTQVRRCPGNYPFPLSVQLEDCEEMPCIVAKGTVAILDVQFVATKDDMFDIQAEVRASVLGINIPYPLPNDGANVCANLLYGAYCPLYATEDVTYHIDFPLDSTLPEVSVKCEVKLYDKDKDVVTCFMVDLKVRKTKPNK